MAETVKLNPYILYADDDNDDQHIFADICRTTKPEIKLVTANNGNEAFSYLTGLQDYEPLPCLIILDINMPVLNGPSTVKMIRSNPRYHAIPIALISAARSFGLSDVAGISDVSIFTKPENMDQLTAMFHQMIALCDPDVRKSLGLIS